MVAFTEKRQIFNELRILKKYDEKLAKVLQIEFKNGNTDIIKNFFNFIYKNQTEIKRQIQYHFNPHHIGKYYGNMDIIHTDSILTYVKTNVQSACTAFGKYKDCLKGFENPVIEMFLETINHSNDIVNNFSKYPILLGFYVNFIEYIEKYKNFLMIVKLKKKFIQRNINLFEFLIRKFITEIGIYEFVRSSQLIIPFDYDIKTHEINEYCLVIVYEYTLESLYLKALQKKIFELSKNSQKIIFKLLMNAPKGQIVMNNFLKSLNDTDRDYFFHSLYNSWGFYNPFQKFISSLNGGWNWKNVIKNEDCCICLCCILDEKITLECNHSFCSECISKWLSISDLCPFCRKYVGKLKKFRFFSYPGAYSSISDYEIIALYLFDDFEERETTRELLWLWEIANNAMYR